MILVSEIMIWATVQYAFLERRQWNISSHFRQRESIHFAVTEQISEFSGWFHKANTKKKNCCTLNRTTIDWVCQPRDSQETDKT